VWENSFVWLVYISYIRKKKEGMGEEREEASEGVDRAGGHRRGACV
jgi:hypothetical protein